MLIISTRLVYHILEEEVKGAEFMAKKRYEFEPQDEGIRYPYDAADPQNVPESLPASPDFNQPLAPAKSQMSTGRGCPRCSGDLTLFEYIKEEDLVTVKCKKCTRVWHAPDLESDELYRIISPQAILRYENKIDREAVLEARRREAEGDG